MYTLEANHIRHPTLKEPAIIITKSHFELCKTNKEFAKINKPKWHHVQCCYSQTSVNNKH